VADTLARLARWRVRLGFVAGLVAFGFARPTWSTWWAGLAVAIAGEIVRIWAAGHLEKSREVTRSGPYRWMRHPLYVGSILIAAGAAVAARNTAVAAVIALYMASTITAAVRTEEAHLRQAFGDTYDRYRESLAEPMPRAFSIERVVRNREYRAAVGLLLGFALLALKVRASV
jgi:protein-S-isoprenylcysteine O-methyltransferase Ste14